MRKQTVSKNRLFFKQFGIMMMVIWFILTEKTLLLKMIKPGKQFINNF